MDANFQGLKEKIVTCRRCPRLVAFRENVPLRSHDGTPWRRPVPGFGDEKGWLLILGLAPSAGGGNRTGRLFTGDESGRFLMKALHDAGFANHPLSENLQDGLQLRDCYLTAAVKCVPPHNRPERDEALDCSSYLENELFLLKNLRAVLALGKFAFDAYQAFLIRQGVLEKRAPFTHGSVVNVPGWPSLYGSYHTSPQNTYTGKLTEKMMADLLKRITQEQAP